MFDIGWSEMAVIAVIALVVIGPKDLPRVLRVAGQWAGKARRIAREFQGNIDQLVRESEVDQIKKEAEEISRYDVKAELEQSIDPTGDLARAVDPSPGEGSGPAAGEGETAGGDDPAAPFTAPGSSPLSPSEPPASDPAAAAQPDAAPAAAPSQSASSPEPVGAAAESGGDNAPAAARQADRQ